MIDRGKRIVAVLIFWLVGAILSAALAPLSGHCENLRFVFIADSQGMNLDDLINTTVLDTINAQILALSPRPSFVIHGGDQTYMGHSGGAYNFQKFKDAVQSLTDAGIKLYTVVGNHEVLRAGTPPVPLGNQQEFQKEFTDNPSNGPFGYEGLVCYYSLGNQQEFQKEFTDNPSNGPPGYERLVYSFESPEGDALFVVGDCYYLTADVPKPTTKLVGDGYFDGIQLAWLVNELAKTKATHKFFFVHAPYYQIFGDQEYQQPSFTELWSILDKNRFNLFCCGHLHAYSRKTIDGSIAPAPQLSPPVQWQHNVTQLIIGSSGGPVTINTPAVDRNEWNVFNNDNTYYFSVIDINGRRVSVRSYGGTAAPYQLIDYFSNVNISPAIDLMLSQ